MGVISFLIIGLMNTINFIIFWSINNIFSKISGFMGIIFNIALVLFFNYLRNLEPTYSEEYASDDIEEIIKDIKNKK